MKQHQIVREFKSSKPKERNRDKRERGKEIDSNKMDSQQMTMEKKCID